MRRILILCTTALIAVSVWAGDLLAPKVVIYKDMSKYKFVYIIPTGSVTSNSGTSGSVFGGTYGVYGGVHGGATKTVNPAEEICGHLVKRGYTILPAINPDLADETMIVAYGNAGKRTISAFAYATTIVLQFTDAETHEKLATFETEGCGSDETEDVRQAIARAFNVYDSGLAPYVKLKIEEDTRSKLVLRMYNRTPKEAKNYKLRIRYYKEKELVHEQYYTANTSIRPGESEKLLVKRDKEARASNYAVKVTIEDYE